jgi:1-acyl-sn-glycerol-3-phosphate acyltransferase
LFDISLPAWAASSDFFMVYQIIRWWATIFLRLYFRKTIVYGVEHIPRKGPLIVASNHPSAFLEASILGTVLGRPLHYLVRGDMFHPKFAWLFDWTNQIPIYRQKDGISNLRKNASSFELTYRKLADGEAVLIFPEAKTTLEKRMRPIQRGTAHLAFGTLPFIKKGEELPILPVGVNYTEPRLPGTDVVVRFGSPFMTQQATRDDREAIDSFTQTLSDAMSPLIVQIPEEGLERYYDVLASVYFRFLCCKPGEGVVHDALVRISAWVNQQGKGEHQFSQIHDFIQGLKKQHISEAVYFPDLLVMNRVGLALMLVMKTIWLVAGGWIWRVARNIIFSKIKANTFKSPVAVGAAMVLYPLVAILFAIACLIFGWPVWYVLVWIGVMWLGVMFRPQLGLIWKVMILGGKSKSKLGSDVMGFKNRVVEILK